MLVNNPPIALVINPAAAMKGFPIKLYFRIQVFLLAQLKGWNNFNYSISFGESPKLRKLELFHKTCTVTIV